MAYATCSVPIEVGYHPMVYITSESIEFVVLNISVFSHPVTGTPRPFTLSVSTQDGTEGIYTCKSFIILSIK